MLALTPDVVAVGIAGVIAGSAFTNFAMTPRLIRAAQSNGEARQLRENFEKVLEEARSREKAEGFIDGKRLTEKEFWDGFERQMFPLLDTHNTFPLRKKTVIQVRERLAFRKFTLAWETVVSITLTTDIASPADLAKYLEQLVTPLIPVATRIMLGT
jgi:hypothetical protein